MSDVFSEAIVTITGYGQSACPDVKDVPLDPLVRHNVDQIFDFVDHLEPDWSQLDLAAAGDWARERIAERFPFLLPDALNALVWSCNFGWK